MSLISVIPVLNCCAGCQEVLPVVRVNVCVLSMCSYILRCVAELQRGPAVLQTLNLLSMMAHSHDNMLKDKVTICWNLPGINDLPVIFEQDVCIQEACRRCKLTVASHFNCSGGRGSTRQTCWRPSFACRSWCWRPWSDSWQPAAPPRSRRSRPRPPRPPARGGRMPSCALLCSYRCEASLQWHYTLNQAVCTCCWWTVWLDV